MIPSAPAPDTAWDEEAFGEEGLTRRERLRMEREARRLARPRTRLRLTAVTAVVAGLLVWLVISWFTSSPSASEELPDPPALEEGQRGMETPPQAGDSADDAADGGGDGGEGGEQTEATLVVHVAGAVEEPGVVELPVGSRVHEALEAAGGPQEDAAPDVLNLAEEIQDGSLITVPTQQEVDDGAFDPGQEGSGGQEGGEEGQGGLIDLNRAEAAELEELPGVGPALSERIVAHREEHGPFEALEDLAAVSGIGPAILADVEDLVTW